MFKTDRIKLRKLALEDHSLYNEWRNDTDVMVSTSPYLGQYTSHDTQSFIEMLVSQHNAKGYIIETLDDAKSIGIVSLINIDTKNRNAELIIDIGDKSMWGQGIGKDALNLILNYGFNEMNLNRISLQVFDFNNRAIKLYEKLGFKHEGAVRQGLYRDGAYHDIIMMGILKSEY